MSTQQNTSYSQFKTELMERLRVILGDTATPENYSAVKNNGVVLDGLAIRTPGRNIAPAIYLNAYYEEYQQGRPLPEILWDILDLFRASSCPEDFPLEQFTDFSQAKQKICFRLVSYKDNRGLLKDLPHRRFLDLAVIYYLNIDYQGRKAAITIHNEHAALWNVRESTLYRLAFRNTEALGWNLRPMQAVLLSLLGKDPTDMDPADLPGENLYVLSNNEGCFGSTCILFTDRLQEFADACQGDLYLLPSSIHEFLILPVESSPDYPALCHMVEEVNRTEVDVCDRLSDHVYRFSRSLGTILDLDDLPL